MPRLGRRIVLTQLDSIAYHNPAYFSDYADWRGYRELARQALAFADRVVFCSPHARDDSLAEDLVDDERAVLVPLGIDHHVVAPRASRSRPRASRAGPFLLCLGTDFLHKNHPFALELFERLRERHGFDGPARARRPARGAAARPRQRGGGVARARTRSSPPTSSRSASAPRPRRRGCTARPRSCSTPRRSRASASSRSRRPRRARPSLWADQSSMGDLLPSEHAGIVAVGRRRQRRQRRAADRGPGRARGARDAVRAAGARLHLGPHRRAAARRLPRGRDRAAARPRPSRTSRSPTSRCRSSARAAS